MDRGQKFHWVLHLGKFTDSFPPTAVFTRNTFLELNLYFRAQTAHSVSFVVLLKTHNSKAEELNSTKNIPCYSLTKFCFDLESFGVSQILSAQNSWHEESANSKNQVFFLHKRFLQPTSRPSTVLTFFSRK